MRIYCTNALMLLVKIILCYEISYINGQLREVAREVPEKPRATKSFSGLGEIGELRPRVKDHCCIPR